MWVKVMSLMARRVKSQTRSFNESNEVSSTGFTPIQEAPGTERRRKWNIFRENDLTWVNILILILMYIQNFTILTDSDSRDLCNKHHSAWFPGWPGKSIHLQYSDKNYENVCWWWNNQTSILTININSSKVQTTPMSPGLSMWVKRRIPFKV